MLMGGFSFPPADNVPRYMDAPLAPVDRLRSWVGWNGEKVDPLFGPPSYVLRFDYGGRIVYTDLPNGYETAILLQEDNAMTAGPWTVYDNALLGITEGLFNLNTNKLAMILLGQAYMPTVATDATYSNVSAFELATANGYTVGGVIIPNTSEVMVADAVTLSGSAASWANFSAQFRWAVIVRQAGNSLAPTDLLLCYSDCTGASALSQGAGPLTIMADPTPILTFTHQP